MDPVTVVLMSAGAAALVALVVVVVIRRSGGQAAADAEARHALALQDLQTRLQAVEAERDDIRARSAEKDARISGLESGREHQEKSLQQRDGEIERLRQEKETELARVRTEKDADLRALREAKEARDRELAELKQAHQELTTAAAKDAENAAARLKDLSEAREQMLKEFQQLAQQVMEKNAKTFSEQNRTQIDGLLNPLKEKIGEFQKGIGEAQAKSIKDHAELAAQIRGLQQHSEDMTRETLNLTRALKGKAQTQGAWGEMVLSTILERSGLRDGHEYSTQQSETLEDGRRLRPDVVVHLPNNHKIIIDSKVSLVAFEEYINSEDDAERAGALTRHVESLRTHVNGLASKDYSRIDGVTTDYVVLFVPIEGAFAAALEARPDLTGYAIERNVTMATPTTLITILRTVGNLWQIERQQRNAEDIANRARLLYDKFVGFVGDMQDIGSRLDQARGAHEKAMNKLTTGSGNLIGQATKLKELGVSPKRELPAALVERADPLDEDEMDLIPEGQAISEPALPAEGG